MSTIIVDYNSGNLRSAEKSFQRMSDELGLGQVIVSSDPNIVRKADHLILPGVGAIEEHVKSGKPFMGICVGMQMMATRGLEHGDHDGFDWIKGDVKLISPNNKKLKIPHMGWNNLNLTTEHPVFNGIQENDHAYFVHSYQLKTANKADLLATVDYGGIITAAVARENIIGTQFHPEKSQSTGLRLISNFLSWKP